MGTNKRFYQARAVQGQLGETAGGKPEVAVSFDILTEGATHAQLTWHGYFTEATEERTIESLRIAGWKGDDLSVFSEGFAFPDDAPEVSLVVEDETYEGKLYTKVQWVNRAGGAAVKTPLVGDKAKAFAAAMKEKFRAFDAANGKRTARPAPSKPAADKRPEPPPLTDADIPF